MSGRKVLIELEGYFAMFCDYGTDARELTHHPTDPKFEYPWSGKVVDFEDIVAGKRYRLILEEIDGDNG